MGRKFFQKYSRKCFRHTTGDSFYCLVGEISSLLGNIYLFYNLSGKRSKKSEQISVFLKIISAFYGKNFLKLRRFVKCSHIFDIFQWFGNMSENSVNFPQIYEIFPFSVGKSMLPKD